MKKCFVVLLLLFSVCNAQDGGRFDAGFDSLKWGMTVDQAKLLFASDTISAMTVSYNSELIVKMDGRLSEHTLQVVRATTVHDSCPLNFGCTFIDNGLCEIDIAYGTPLGDFHPPGSFDRRAFAERIVPRFDYLDAQTGFLNKTDTYPADINRWRTDSKVLIRKHNGETYREDIVKVEILLKDAKPLKDLLDIQIAQKMRRTSPFGVKF